MAHTTLGSEEAKPVKRRSYQQIARCSGSGVEKLLGELEAEIMTLLWAESGTATVRDVLGKITARREHPVAYTTVMTVMARLADKGLLERTLSGNLYEYRVAQSREEFLRHASEKIATELIADFGEVAVAGFVSALERVEPQRLRDLRRHVRQHAAAEDQPR